MAEPPSAYRVRPPVVVDASVLAAALFGERGEAEAMALLRGRSLVAPHLLDVEIASVGLKKLRQERLAAGAVESALQAYARLPIERHAVDPAAVVAFARECDITVYDAAYLWVAASVDAPLATFDERLATAAERYLTRAARLHDRESP